jgi:LacI family transcriptional regulator
LPQARIAGPEAHSTGEARTRAFAQTAEKLGIDTPTSATIHAERFDGREGMRRTKLLFDRGRPWTAFLCANDR